LGLCKSDRSEAYFCTPFLKGCPCGREFAWGVCHLGKEVFILIAERLCLQAFRLPRCSNTQVMRLQE
jgi:hypothetical protein